ncbi:MFS transporter [Salinarimonas sp. NSM]|uniref:MFS transporter n=1 Tax=Salinarimonas sp. NSM TaxID=3458003 RepID=UPI00403654FB
MRHRRIAPLIVATALFMETTDSTVIATALPAIAADLGEDPIALKLAITSYLIALAVFIPVSGWMADRFGARTVFRAALGVFVTGSIACAFADSLGGFVAARFFQGMGGAMMVPVGRLVILRGIPKNELVGALAFLTVPALVGPVLGPPIGGFITTAFSWRWIFIINVPIGLLGMVLASIFIENLREEDTPPLDWRGYLMLGTGLALAMLGLATAGRHLLPLWASAASLGAGVALLALYLRHARRVAHPVMGFSLMALPTFRAGVVGGALFRLGVGAIPFLLPLMLQLGFGLDPLNSGLITFAAAAGALFMKTLAARIIRAFGFRSILVWNSLVCAVFIAVMGIFRPEMPYVVMLAILLVGGCFRSLQFTALNALSFADVVRRDMSQATTLSSVVQQVALAVGVTIAAFALEAFSALAGNDRLVTADFTPAFLFMAALSGLAFFVFARLDPDAGAEMSGHRRSLGPAPASPDRDPSTKAP